MPGVLQVVLEASSLAKQDTVTRLSTHRSDHSTKSIMGRQQSIARQRASSKGAEEAMKTPKTAASSLSGWETVEAGEIKMPEERRAKVAHSISSSDEASDSQSDSGSEASSGFEY